MFSLKGEKVKKDLNFDIINEYVVARGGIEPPTHGFSVRFKVLLLNFIE